jgi:hypothetical protein
MLRFRQEKWPSMPGNKSVCPLLQATRDPSFVHGGPSANGIFADRHNPAVSLNWLNLIGLIPRGLLREHCSLIAGLTVPLSKWRQTTAEADKKSLATLSDPPILARWRH